MHTCRLSSLAIFTVVLTFAFPAGAVTGCTNAWLNGNFGMHFSGTSSLVVAGGIGGISVPPGMTGEKSAPAAGLLRFTLDGTGGVTGYSATNLDGSWLLGNVTGAYEVNSDCTATFTINDAANVTQHFSGVIVGQGDSVFLLQTDAGAAVSGQLKKVRAFCQTADLAGAYGIQYSGDILGTAGGAFSAAGVLTLDGQGSAFEVESRSSGGTSTQVASAGTISVASDCSVALSLSSAATNTTVNFFGLISADTKQLLIVQSDARTAVNGDIVIQ